MMYGYGNMISPSNRLFSGGGGANPLWEGLLAYYTADNTPNDALGTYNGTLVNGATYGTGIINQGFSFDGVNDYVNLGNNLDFDGSTAFTFNFWVNKNANKFHALINKQGGSPNYTGYIFRINQTSPGKLELIINSTSTNRIFCTSSDSFPSSIYSMVTVTYDGSQNANGVKFYINGVDAGLIITANTLTTSISNSNDCTLGAAPLGGNQYLNGLMDEGSVFNVVKTQSEITELYNSGLAKQYPN